MSSPSLGKPSRKLLATPIIEIKEPQAYPAITNVRCPGSSGVPGTICAFGRATWDSAPLTAVWAKVYDPSVAVLPLTHPADAVQGVAPTKPGGHLWQFIATEIPVIAACCPAAPPTANNGLLAIWCTFAFGSGPQDANQSTLFAGVASTHTNCQGSGPGSGHGTEIARVGASTTTIVETAPRQYHVSGKGFSGTAVAHLNAHWTLELRIDAHRELCIWDNGGDGVRVPHVELCCDGVVATEWRLTLTHAGRRVYSRCSAHEWNVLGVNMVTVLAEEGDLEGLRGILTVIPA